MKAPPLGLAMLVAGLLASTSAAGGSRDPSPHFTTAFIIGADLSGVPQQEDAGIRFTDTDGSAPNGTTVSGGGLLTILRNHGFNYVRLRLFVDPAAPGGYSPQGYCDLPHTLCFGAGVKRAGMGFLLDLHYSDTWADPGHQAKPAAWAQLGFEALQAQVRAYTREVVVQLVAAGARPDMVQIGNEIPAGLLWDDGRVSGQSFGNLATLLQAAIRGVKEVDASIEIVLHLDRCHDLATNRWWVDGLQERGVDFDILAESCYDLAGYQQPASAWAPTLSELARIYPHRRFLVAEYSPAKALVNRLMLDLPDRRGLGAFIWEPTSWGERLFDARGRALPAAMGFFDSLAATSRKR